jgi:serine/threonine protein kinase
LFRKSTFLVRKRIVSLSYCAIREKVSLILGEILKGMKLSSRFVMPIAAVGMNECGFYFFYRLATPLTHRMTEKNQFQLSNIFSITLQLLQCLSHFFESNFVHNDIKPQNVVLDNGNAKFIDLADGKFLPHGFVSDERSRLTVEYAAPERFLNRFSFSVILDSFLNLQSDMWSFGVTVMHMICNFLGIPKTPMTDCINYYKKSIICDIDLNKRRSFVSELAQQHQWKDINFFWKTCSSSHWAKEKRFRNLLVLVGECLRMIPEERISPAAAISLLEEVKTTELIEPDWVKNL